MKKIYFLTTEDVLELQKSTIDMFEGGGYTLRDRGLLESALAQPQVTFSGKYMYQDYHSKAAAYIFSITKNHPFIDGNKRVGLLAAATFLDKNGFEVTGTDITLYELAYGIACSEINQEQAITILKN